MRAKFHIPHWVVRMIRWSYKVNNRRLLPGVGFLLYRLPKVVPALQANLTRMQDGRLLYLDLSIEDHLLTLLYGELHTEFKEVETVRSILRTGDIVVDGGAFVGTHTTLMATCVGKQGRVYAIEPNPHNLKLLKLTAQLYPNLRVIPVALGDKPGTANFFVPKNNPSCASLSSLALSESTEIYEVPVNTLHAIVEQEGITPTFIKLDLEGYEVPVLRTSRHLISRPNPPIWMLEVAYTNAERFGCNPNEYFSIFNEYQTQEHKFYMIQRSDGRLKEVTYFPETADDGANWYNILVVPESSLDRVRHLIV